MSRENIRRPFPDGLEDDTYLMIHPDSVHRQVKKLDDAGEAFPFTMRAIMKRWLRKRIAEPGKDTIPARDEGRQIHARVAVSAQGQNRTDRGSECRR